MVALLLVFVCVLGGSSETWAADPVDEGCATAKLAKARASASIRLDHDERVHTKVTSQLTVHVPSSWPLGHDLLLSEDTDEYRWAMSCLTRPYVSQYESWQEWRPTSPRITPEDDGLRVQVDTYSWVNDHQRPITVGPWKITVGSAHWLVHFEPASALSRVDWETITVDPGRPGAKMVAPRPTTGEGATALVWKPEGEKAAPDVTVRLRPSWQRSWAAQDDRLLLADISGAVVLWDVAVAVLLLVATRHGRRRSGVTANEARVTQNLADWAWITLGMVLLVVGDEVLYRHLKALGDSALWEQRETLHRFLFALCSGVLLLAFGRPRRAVAWAGVLLAVPAVAVASWPATFGLLPTLGIPEEAPDRTVITLFVASGCVLALNFLGFAAAGWRLARDGELIPPSRGPAPGPRDLQLRYAGPAVAAAVAVVGLCFALAAERNWRRASWLSDHNDPAYAIAHLIDLRGELTWFTANAQNWWHQYEWMLSGIAIVAALRVYGQRATASPLDERPERLLTLLFFPVMVGLNFGWFVNNGALTPLTVVVYAAALYLAAVDGRRRGVLNLPLERSGDAIADTLTPVRRQHLLDRARRYREIHAKLRRLDQGQSDDDAVARRTLERELRGLHNWRSNSGTADRLPARVSILDAALALGPRDTWWANGRRAAVFATYFGLPASGLMVWAETLRGEFLTNTLHAGFGLPDIVMIFIFWQLVWTGAGFVLGALWRGLPGRRGPAKALPVAGAFALPIGMQALGNWAIGQGQTNLALYAVTMLLVLTLTGIAIDLDTFHSEQRYWQSRFGLLLSVYQMRYFSLQFAYLAAQVIAVITIWQFFADPSGPPPKELGGR